MPVMKSECIFLSVKLGFPVNLYTTPEYPNQFQDLIRMTITFKPYVVQSSKLVPVGSGLCNNLKVAHCYHRLRQLRHERGFSDL
jgi:hypothetical protein